MKKTIAIILSLFVAAGFAFSQSEASALPEDEIKVDLTKKIIIPENQHLNSEDKTGKVEIEYIPMVDEARIYYTCMYNFYEQGNAMNSILGCLEDFTKNNNYYNYKYMEKDRERYYKDNRGIKWAQYSAHVKFVR